MTTKNTKRIYKVKWSNLGKLTMVSLITVLLVILCIGLIISVKDYIRTKAVIREVNNKIEVETTVDDKNTTNIKQESTLSKFDIYWDYVKLGLLDVDMATLKAMNADTIGFIEVKGTNFSYPVVANRDGYYKDHSFNKKKNSYGWIYLDDDSTLEELKTNNIIYGNKGTTGTLFNDLNKVFKKSWQEDNNNFIIRYSTGNYSALFQIVSVYKSSDDFYKKCEFENDEEVDEFLEQIVKKSEYKFKTNVRNIDKILTLTTNSKGSNIVVHAKLIKIKKESND